MYFKNRRDAGKQLCQLLKEYRNMDVVVYALPRGGVVVAEEIANFLHAPLDLIFAHKIGHPYQPEYAVAATSESGHLIVLPEQQAYIDKAWLEREKEHQIEEIKRKRKTYLSGKKEISVQGKIAIIVDDGIATGLTMLAGIKELKDRLPKKIIVVAPVAPKSKANLLKTIADDFVGMDIADDEFLGSVGAYYEEFNQVEDDEVIDILANHAKKYVPAVNLIGDKEEGYLEKLIHITHGHVTLEGMLKIPQSARGIVLFAHGSGSGRFSPRNNFVADVLNEAGLATLLIDLLSKEEDEVYQTRFDIHLLSQRLGIVVQWLEKKTETKDLSIGLFGASTGAAAALQVASAMGKKIQAVVSRGGRPDLAMDVLDVVTAPTLFIVGGNDFGVIELNQEAYEQLVCLKKIEIIPNATHLFEEPGCLEEVARVAKEWFVKHLASKKKQGDENA